MTNISAHDVREPRNIPVSIGFEIEAVLPHGLATPPVVIRPLGSVSPDPGPVPEKVSSKPGIRVGGEKKRVDKVILLLISEKIDLSLTSN